MTGVVGARRLTTLIVVGVVAVLLAVGLSIVRDFGVSTDEYPQYVYAQQTVGIYLDQSSPEDAVAAEQGLGHGPFYAVFSLFSTRILTQLPLDLETFQARHLTYYLTFVLGIVAMLMILQRYVPWAMALAGTAFFASQPVIFGHAFIIPKDMPMLGFFTASIALGLLGIDGLRHSRLIARVGNKRRCQQAHGQPEEPDALPSRGPWTVVLAVLVAGVVLGAVDLGFTHWSLRAAVKTLDLAYQGQSAPALTQLFNQIATDAWKTPLSAYLDKLLGIYIAGASIGMGLLIMATAWATAKLRLGISLPALARRYRHWALWLMAAVCLGLTMPVRVVGAFAGALMAGLLVWNFGVRGLLGLVPYGGLAAITSVATWPYLWGNPFGRLVSSLSIIGRYPHETSVLFGGSSYLSTDLPWSYLPWLMLIQFTLPLIPLAIFGAYESYRGERLGKGRGKELFVIGLWFVVPMVGNAIMRPTLYGGFRQVLFIVPPLFVLAGVGLNGIWRLIRVRVFAVGLVGLILIPGIVGIVQLHPYKYVYYNALVGGTRGAFRSYEMDYWCTSLREATLANNQIANQNDEVAVLFRDTAQVAPFARPDLHVVRARTVNDILAAHPNEILACSPAFNFRHADEWTILAEVGRQGAVFAKVMRGPGQ